MLKKELHPFNDTYGRNSISPETTKLIVGSFPPYQVVNQIPRLKFYYGSAENKFWDLLGEVFGVEFSSIEDITGFLKKQQLGVIDIIKSCYRRGSNSSKDEDLAIIELEDIINIVQSTDISDIYTTSQFVTTLLKEELTPIYDWTKSQTKENNFEYEIWQKDKKRIRLFTLYSPSPRGLSGIQKGLNKKDTRITAAEHRLNQYRSLLLIPPPKKV
jgi:G:T/U-mismatch repair DNA glycosylase